MESAENLKILHQQSLPCGGFRWLKNLVLLILFILLAVMAGATVVEKIYGSETALDQIYHSWGFVALWAIFGTLSIVYFVKNFFSSVIVHKLSVYLIHFSLVIILLGALISYLCSERGYVHIRQGESANYFISEDDAVKRHLPFSIKLLLFDIEYHEDGKQPADYISFIQTEEAVHRISMNKIFQKDNFRFYQMNFDSDEMGTWLLVSRDPAGIAVTYLGYALFALSFIVLLFLRIGWKGVLYAFAPVMATGLLISQIKVMTPVLRSPFLAVHVSVIMVSYLLLLLILLMSIAGLMSSKRRSQLYRASRLALYPALFLLAVGIFLGAVWANISWGRYWGWDAKETWALITLLIYALPLHRRMLPCFSKPKPFFIYCSIAFVSLLMTFLGVTFLLGGMHSYV